MLIFCCDFSTFLYFKNNECLEALAVVAIIVVLAAVVAVKVVILIMSVSLVELGLCWSLCGWSAVVLHVL